MLGPCHEEVSTVIQTKKGSSDDESYNSRPVSTLVFLFPRWPFCVKASVLGRLFY